MLIFFSYIKESFFYIVIKDIEKGKAIINFYGNGNYIALYTYYRIIIKDNIYHV